MIFFLASSFFHFVCRNVFCFPAVRDLFFCNAVAVFFWPIDYLFSFCVFFSPSALALRISSHFIRSLGWFQLHSNTNMQTRSDRNSLHRNNDSHALRIVFVRFLGCIIIALSFYWGFIAAPTTHFYHYSDNGSLRANSNLIGIFYTTTIIQQNQLTNTFF